MNGDGHLSSVEILNKTTGEKKMLPTAAVFSFIGATPRTDCYRPKSKRTRSILCAPESSWGFATLDLETAAISVGNEPPGVFAAGDVRSGSVKRVASAVGEGSMAVQFVHEYLKTM